MQALEHRERVALFDQLYKAHHQAVHAYLLGRTGHAPTAMDLVQETFLNVWRHIDKARALSEDARRYWLFRIAKNTVIGYYRRQQRKRTLIEQVQRREELAPPLASDPSEAYVTKETVVEVDRAIQKLPETLRVPLVMQVLGQMSSTEIGKILGRPPGTVRYQIARARKQIEDELKKQYAVAEARQ